MTFRKLIAFAIPVTAALVIAGTSLPAAAQSTSQARTTADLNVRSGPSTDYRSLFVLPAGTVITLTQCNQGITWCELTYQNRTGWASARYMTSVQLERPVGQVAGQLGLAILGAVVQQFLPQQPQQPNPPQGPRRPSSNEVCFYTDTNFAGSYFCDRVGADEPIIESDFNNEISSIAVGSNAVVEACTSSGLNGLCSTYNADVERLTGSRNNAYSSYRITSRGQSGGGTIPGFPFPIPGGGGTPGGGTSGGPRGQACFYDGPNYTGAQFCVFPPQDYAYLPANWDDAISSLRVAAGVTVRVCGSSNLGGWCEVYTSDRATLPGSRDNDISSFSIR